MNNLMRQLLDKEQVKNREPYLCADWHNRVIQFNRKFKCWDGQRYVWIQPVFYIDTKPTEYGNDPVVTSPYVSRFPARGHANHLYNDHSLCLGNGLYNWDLLSLLRQIEKWFGGFYEWTQTGVFRQSNEIYS